MSYTAIMNLTILYGLDKKMPRVMVFSIKVYRLKVGYKKTFG